jgi:GntR family transcriptional regulator
MATETDVPRPPRGERYAAIATDLRAAIGREEYGAGTRLPTEIELAERYQVTRPTVRQAIDLLEAEGLVVRVPRQGTYVRTWTPMEWRMTHGAAPDHLHKVPVDSDSYQADAEAAGYSSRQVITVGVEQACTRLDVYSLAELLRLDPADLVLARRRVRYLGERGRPAETAESLADSYYPLKLAEDTAIMTPQSVNTAGILAERGYVTTRITDILIPRMASADERAKLSLPPVTAILERIRVTFTADGQPVYVQHVITPGNGARVIYDVDFTNGTAGRG